MAYIFPGWNCKVDEIPLHPAYNNNGPPEMYPTALGDKYGYRIDATTLREKRWQEMMNDITDKLDWQSKVRNKKIYMKWKQEALEYGLSVREGFSEQMADQMIIELQQKADDHESTGWITAFDPGVIKSDAAVSESLKKSLQAAVQVLENVSESAKDWHPGTIPQVLDLVHPSLWPLIYGKTKILLREHGYSNDPIADIGTGQVLPALPRDQRDWEYSNVFQWLPADVSYNENKQAKFSSYINNLHPQKHHDLYQIIEKVVDAAIPLWGRTLSSWPVQPRIVYDTIKYREQPRIPRHVDESDNEYKERARLESWALKEQYILQPEPHKDKIEYVITDLKEQFPAGLQIIVKLQNIELQPGESYAGGSWHVEGQANEHIVATALYYYDSHNITESRLAFRHSADGFQFLSEDFDYDQGDHRWLPVIFGLHNETGTTQDIGSVRCQEGRLITFPNTLQHRVSPFELQDKSKLGHRKILALFLVDPHFSIISTRSVPPQQQDWWTERILQTPGIPFVEKLPPELIQLIFSYIDDPMSLETAKEWRLRLMAERSRYVREQDWHFTTSFNLCEH